jgi:hypothetical protein
MIKDLDTSELEKLKGIGIGMTHDEQPFLIITYQKKMMREEALTWVYWLVIAALLGVTGLVFWWAVQ